MLACQRDAGAKLLVRGAHAALQVVAVAEAADGSSFGLERAGCAGLLASAFVFVQAFGRTPNGNSRLPRRWCRRESSSVDAASSASGSASSSIASPSAMRSLRRIAEAIAIIALPARPASQRSRARCDLPRSHRPSGRARRAGAPAPSARRSGSAARSRERRRARPARVPPGIGTVPPALRRSSDRRPLPAHRRRDRSARQRGRDRAPRTIRRRARATDACARAAGTHTRRRGSARGRT